MAVPIAVVVLLGVLTVGVVQTGRDRARAEAERTVRAAVATSVIDLRAALQSQLSDAAAAAGPSVVAVPAGGGGVSADVAAQARDTGTAVLDDRTRPPAVVVPVFRGDSPVGTAARRAAITGFRLVPIVLATALSDVTRGGLVVRGPHRVVSATSRTPPSTVVSYTVDMGVPDSPGWTVQAWVPAPGTPAITWLWVSCIAVVALAVAVAVGRAKQRTRAAESRAARLERDRRLIDELAPVLQASLDLGEVVPAVASRLCDELALAGLSLAAPSEHGERQLFASGAPPDPAAVASTRAPERLATGDTFALSLNRGGRVLGVLRVVADAELTHEDLIALITAGDLLGSTLANAEAFAQQLDLVERMRSVDELKTVFLATASHELRTPVTAIAGFSALLLQQWDELDPERARELMQRVQVNSERLAALIEQLLDFAQLERGLPRADDEALDLADTVTQILTDHAEVTNAHRVATYLTPRCVVRGSRAALERVVVNLIGNAAKYAPTGTVISVTVRREGGRAVLLVDDEGPGVPEDDRERVFSRFYRGHGDAIVRTRGAGVGLAIVAEYAASMSGVADVREAPSGGARFSVSFPAPGVTAADRRPARVDVFEGV